VPLKLNPDLKKNLKTSHHSSKQQQQQQEEEEVKDIIKKPCILKTKCLTQKQPRVSQSQTRNNGAHSPNKK
jgi:hypothetical protein